MAKVDLRVPHAAALEPEIIMTTEEILIQKLRDRVQDVIKADEKFDDDFYLLQWLKAQHMRLDGAETMIRNSLKWRKENKIDELLDQDFEPDVIDKFNVHVDGVDHEGAPVITLHVGQWDVRAFVEKKGREAYVRFLSQVFVKCEKAMIEYNKRRNRCDGTKSRPPITASSSRGLTMVMSARDYSKAQAKSIQTIFAVIECTKVFSAYFPQIVHTVFIVNVDTFFMIILKIIKPFLFLPEIHVFDHNKESWKQKILNRIPGDQLLVEFGGCKTTAALLS